MCTAVTIVLWFSNAVCYYISVILRLCDKFLIYTNLIISYAIFLNEHIRINATNLSHDECVLDVVLNLCHYYGILIVAPNL